MRQTLSWILVVIALTACNLDSSPGGAPSLNTPAVLEVVGGADQVAKATTKLPAAIIVRVSDSRKEPVLGVAVVFDVVLGEGALSATTVKTDAGGNAQVDWTLGADTGAQQLEARVTDPKSDQVVLSARIGATAAAP